MVLVGPCQDIAANVQPPTADLPDGLGTVQVLPALSQLILRFLARRRFLNDDVQADHIPLAILNG